MQTIATYLRMEDARSGCFAVRTIQEGETTQADDWLPIDQSLLTDSERELLRQGRTLFLHSNHANYAILYRILKPAKSQQKGTKKDERETYLKKKWRGRKRRGDDVQADG